MAQPKIKASALDVFPGASKIVVTDASGNIVITGSLTVGGQAVLTLASTGTATSLNIGGNAATATTATTATSATTATQAGKLTTGRTIALSGGVTGTATSFDGSANITIPVTAVAATSLVGTVPTANLTGTYAISISGNAATATSVSTATSGTYTPVASAQFNCTGVVMGIANWTRLGNIITFIGGFSCTRTTASQFMNFYATVPSGLTPQTAAGIIVSGDINNTVAGTGNGSVGGLSGQSVGFTIQQGSSTGSSMPYTYVASISV